MCRVANRHVVKLAGPLQLLQSWIFWRFPSFRPTGYDAFSWPLASSNKGPRVQMARLKIDLLQPRDFIWMPYSALDVIQPPPRPALNIDFLMSKDGRGGDRWFPAHLPDWHLHWQERAEHILQFDIVADPGPSHDFLTWWHQHGKRFLSPEMLLGDPRGIPIPYEAMQWSIISGSTSLSSASSNKPSPTPAGVGHCTSVGRCSPYRTSSPILPLRSMANDREATGCIGGSYTGTEDEATAGLELEPATVAIVLAFRFEPPELDTTSTNFANNSDVLTSGNCLRQRNITCKSSSLPIVKQSYFTVSWSTVVGMR
ncbi:hypothetical protein Ahy_B03g062529 [Arachis hypogaea]|uniref:Aminotransferase-like plant mobile domain-containing protein n=1 Tax=Arachis hypogaea TaxID=3818 RepID=A0A444ZUK3_ARAHY|nr:hypothetical protein Ahy_B03g062529 [Arachis hypogaea]